MKSKIITIISVFVMMVCGVSSAYAVEPSMSDYTSYPISITESVQPNILILLDNSGSMNFCAYGDWPGDGGLVTTHPYSGAGYTGTVETTVSTSSDDAEERVSDGYSFTGSADLDLAYENNPYFNMLNGTRFKEVEIPQGATITNAYIEFTAYANSAAAVAGATLTFTGQDIDDAPTFTGTNSDISGRTDTTASVNWEVPAWTSGTAYQSPDISSIVQEIVNRSGWSSGNGMVFKISSSSGQDARRQARSRDNSESQAPLLHVEYAPAEATTYYGYFDPESRYTYSSNQFERDPTGEWDGNWLNWLCMRRIDVARKVLVGGLSGGNPTLTGDDHNAQPSRYYRKNFNNSQDAMDAGIVVSPYTDQAKNYYYGIKAGYIYADDDSDPFSGYIKRYTIKVKKDETEEPGDFLDGEVVGILQRLEDKARWGLGFYNSSEGGNVSASADRGNITDIVNKIQNKKADTWTPLAEAFYEMVRYFQQVSPYYYNGDYTTNNQFDPYYWKDLKDFVPCGKSFILLITDGESTMDKNIPSSLRDYDNDGNDSTFYDSDGSNYLDDVALWAHTTDLRPDLDGTQNITLYTVFAFGSGSDLLKDAAKNGAFIDKDGDNSPNLVEEWDEDGDGSPDAYYQAPSGYELEQQLMEAITDLLKRAASGTAVSVLATSGEGEGNVVQAFFKPAVTSGTDEIKWLGYLQSLWIDDHGNLREDTNDNKILDVGTDKIIATYFDEGTGETRIERYTVSDANPYPDIASETPEAVDMTAIHPLWEAGKILANRDASDRTIYTFVDKDNDGVVDAGEFIPFTTGNVAELKPYLGVKNNATWDYLGSTHDNRVSNLINFIRGIPDGDAAYVGSPTLRERTIDVDGASRVWKLGDIVHSTAVQVSKTINNFGLIYGDDTYTNYGRKYKDRETVVYVGANDGMFHAFSCGNYDRDTLAYTAAGPEGIGGEKWAYIPQCLLPHLKWLPSEDYTHVYYVDLQPMVFDARIFANDASHPNKWGTILLCGMNTGGKDIWSTDDFDGDGSDETRTFSSSYFAMDITVPDNPRLLWEKAYPNVGLTTTIPSIFKVKEKWYCAIGSGPTDYEGNSTQAGHVLILDLATGDLVKDFQTGENKAFMSSPISWDHGVNYNVDCIYVGETYEQGVNWQGKMYRVGVIQTDFDDKDTYVDDPNDPVNPWVMTSIFDSPAPITVPVDVGWDRTLEEIFVYFGTGRYLSTADKTDNQQQYIFGIKDPFFDQDSGAHHSYAGLELDINDLFSADGYTVLQGGKVLGGGFATYDQLVTEVDTHQGWYRSLDTDNPSERVVNGGVFLAGSDETLGREKYIFLVPSFIPNSDICGFGGESWLWALSGETGTAYLTNVIGQVDIGEDADKILDKNKIGTGLAATPAVHIGKSGVKGLIQDSLGGITNQAVDLNMNSGFISWHEHPNTTN
ncbi:MAG: PilC/PilY family type IV pilus protein [Pseudomonadota bacterium]